MVGAGAGRVSENRRDSAGVGTNDGEDGGKSGVEAMQRARAAKNGSRGELLYETSRLQPTCLKMRLS